MDKGEREERQMQMREKEEEENVKKRQEIERLKKKLESSRTLYRVMNKHNSSFDQDPC